METPKIDYIIIKLLFLLFLISKVLFSCSQFSEFSLYCTLINNYNIFIFRQVNFVSYELFIAVISEG